MKYLTGRCEAMANAIVKFCASHKVKHCLPRLPLKTSLLYGNFTFGEYFTCPKANFTLHYQDI